MNSRDDLGLKNEVLAIAIATKDAEASLCACRRRLIKMLQKQARRTERHSYPPSPLENNRDVWGPNALQAAFGTPMYGSPGGPTLLSCIREARKSAT